MYTYLSVVVIIVFFLCFSFFSLLLYLFFFFSRFFLIFFLFFSHQFSSLQHFAAVFKHQIVNGLSTCVFWVLLPRTSIRISRILIAAPKNLSHSLPRYLHMASTQIHMQIHSHSNS